MANGTPDYTLGGLKERADSHERRLGCLEDKIEPLQDTAAEIRGAVSALKWIVGIVGLTTLLNAFSTIASYIR